MGLAYTLLFFAFVVESLVNLIHRMGMGSPMYWTDLKKEARMMFTHFDPISWLYVVLGSPMILVILIIDFMFIHFPNCWLGEKTKRLF